MSLLIYCSPYSFPVAAIAGAIHVGILPPEYDPGRLWMLDFIKEHKGYIHGEPVYLGMTSGGEKVIAFSARAKPFMLTGIIETFLSLNNVTKGQYRLVDIRIPGWQLIWVGKILLGVPLLNKVGKIILNRQIKHFYHELRELISS